MKPIGKTYLIKCEIRSNVELINGLYIPTNHDVDGISDVFYQGKIIAHGTGFSDDEIKNLVPVGTEVVFEYKEKRGTKLIFGKNVYYIKYEDQILGIIEK
jgi:co-chaperonin GroES (HSP10)